MRRRQRWRNALRRCPPTSRKAVPVEAARAQLAMLKEFIVKNNVVSIPSNDEALVAEAPPYNRSNAAFIQVPGPYDHGVASVYNIAPPDPKWSKAEQAAYIPSEATLLFTSVHEVWPGHFLQFLHSNANPSQARRLVGGLWLRRRLGALLRGNDVSRRAWGRAIRRSTSVNSTKRCCATCACCRPSDCTPMA